jgi:hypothetical protein
MCALFLQPAGGSVLRDFVSYVLGDNGNKTAKRLTSSISLQVASFLHLDVLIRLEALVVVVYLDAHSHCHG